MSFDYEKYKAMEAQARALGNIAAALGRISGALNRLADQDRRPVVNVTVDTASAPPEET